MNAVAKKSPEIAITCYGQTDYWTDRNAAIAFYRDCADHSEGCERERYVNVLFDLMDGKTVCSDERW